MRHLFSPKSAKSKNIGINPYQAEVCKDYDFNLLVEVSERYKRTLNLSNDLSYYQRILDMLASNRNCDVQPLKNFFAPLPPDKFRLCIRHDMDIEPFSSVVLSKMLFEAGLQGSFYVLHTTDYYGKHNEGVFYRYSYIPAILLEIQERFLCEVGLHNDALWVYTRWKLDGASAVVAELNWLREFGLHVFGTAAHNSAPVYGAENFEIFEGHAALNRKILHKDGLEVPLQVLREDDLGLTYEANYPKIHSNIDTEKLDRFLSGYPADAARNRNWMRIYLLDNPLCRWGGDYNLWLVGIDTWVISGNIESDPLFLWNVSMETVNKFLDSISFGKKVICHIHPFYINTPSYA